MRQGALDGAFTATTTAATVESDLEVLDLPFLFTDYKQVYAVEQSSVGKKLLSDLSSHGIVGLDYSDLGFRDFGNNKQPIYTPADVQGLKMRAIQGPIPVATYKALGAEPVPLDANEIYTSLQQHVVDGLDTGAPYILSAKLYEVLKFMSVSNGALTAMFFGMSATKWASIPAADQTVIRKATANAAAWGRTYDANYESNSIKGLEAKGMKVNQINDPQAWRAAVAPVYTQIEGTVGKSLVDQVTQLVSQAG